MRGEDGIIRIKGSAPARMTAAGIGDADAASLAVTALTAALEGTWQPVAGDAWLVPGNGGGRYGSIDEFESTGKLIDIGTDTKRRLIMALNHEERLHAVGYSDFFACAADAVASGAIPFGGVAPDGE